MNARETAFLSLMKYENSGVYSNIELSYAIERNGLSGAERGLYTALFYGVIERKLTLDYILSLLSDRPEEDIDLNVRIILRLGLYQLLYMTRIPASAAVNESVKLARRFYAKKNSEAFINAVLRSFLRRRGSIPYPDKEKNTAEYLSVFYSVPVWICRLWLDAYGREKTESILETINAAPTMTLTVNTLTCTPSDFLRALGDAGIRAEPGALDGDCVAHDPSPNDVGGAGNRGEAPTDEPARARLGGSERQGALTGEREQLGARVVQLGVVCEDLALPHGYLPNTT